MHHIRPDMKLQPAYSTNTGIPDAAAATASGTHV
jgi:hypothetical protein